MKNLYTIGYEKADIGSFLAVLELHKTNQVFDVRARAQSRWRPEFSKSQLRATLSGHNIKYTHLPGLGTPCLGRKAYAQKNYDMFREIYKRHIEDQRSAFKDLSYLAHMISGGESCALMCYERDYKMCHRLIICEKLSEDIEVEIVHL